MAEVAKVITIIGSSPESFAKAADAAVQEASKTLRGITGASVLAIARGDQGVIAPVAGEILRAGDVLALAGTHDAVAAATEVLGRGRPGGETSNASG